MTTKTIETLVRVVGGLGILAIAVAVWAAVEMDFKRSVGRPVLQLELAASPEAFAAVLDGDRDHNIATARRQIDIDWFFIAAYWLAFLGLSALLAMRQPPTSRWIGAVAAAIATAGAGFDVIENRGILAALDAYAGHGLGQELVHSMELVRNTREASQLKWALLFALLLLLAGVFLFAPGWRRPLGLLVAAGGAVGLGGLFCCALSCELLLVTIGSGIAFLALLPCLVELLVRPEIFVRSLPTGLAAPAD